MSATPEREQAEALASTVKRALGDDCCTKESEYHDAISALASLAAAVSRLEAEREQMDAQAVRMIERAQVATKARAAAEAQVAALVGRERELTRALQRRIVDCCCDEEDELRCAWCVEDEALAGGGRTPTGTDSGGGKAAVAEVLRRGLGAAVIGLECAVEVHGAVKFDTPEDEQAQDYAMRSMRLALSLARSALTTATVSPPEPVSPGAADVAEAGE